MPPVVIGGERRCRRRVVHEGRWPVAFALPALAQHLAVTADRIGLFPNAAFRGLLVGPAPLHVAEGALALHLLLEHPQRRVDVVVAHEDLHLGEASLFLWVLLLVGLAARRKQKGEPQSGLPSLYWADPARPFAGLRPRSSPVGRVPARSSPSALRADCPARNARRPRCAQTHPSTRLAFR